MCPNVYKKVSQKSVKMFENVSKSVTMCQNVSRWGYTHTENHKYICEDQIYAPKNPPEHSKRSLEIL